MKGLVVSCLRVVLKKLHQSVFRFFASCIGASLYLVLERKDVITWQIFCEETLRIYLLATHIYRE